MMGAVSCVSPRCFHPLRGAGRDRDRVSVISHVVSSTAGRRHSVCRIMTAGLFPRKKHVNVSGRYIWCSDGNASPLVYPSHPCHLLGYTTSQACHPMGRPSRIPLSLRYECLHLSLADNVMSIYALPEPVRPSRHSWSSG